MTKPFPQSTRTVLALLASVLLAVAAPAQSKPARDYSFSDATGEALAKYKTTLDAKNYDGAVAILDAQIAKSAEGSYDLAMLYQFKAQTLLQKGDFSKSVEPLERGLMLSDTKSPTYFDEKTSHGLVYFLAQLYFQEAVQTKDPAVAKRSFDKAEMYVTRWAKETKKPTFDEQHFYASLLYTRAVQNPEKPDLDLVKRALEQVEIGLHSATRPKDVMYLLKFVCLQQLNRNVEATEVLEYLVKQKPDSATYWQQLAALYLSAEQPVRAILAFERAQANGLMNSPKDNFNLVGIYFNIGQYEKAAELLEAGLRNGKIENDVKNWETLAYSYQQLERPLKGIEALKEATKIYPKSGQLEFMIAQAYQGLDQPANALPYAQAAIAKGGLTKPYQVYLFLAYVAYETKKYDIALESANKAATFPEGAKDGKNMAKAIEDLMREREEKKNKKI
jgi:tetratricopeptide (TPR) repeat protein